MESVLNYVKKSVSELFYTHKKKESMQDIIKQIHNDFFTETDKIKEVKLSLSNFDYDIQIDLLKYKAHRLISLGFRDSKELFDIQKRIHAINKNKSDELFQILTQEANEYFSFKYPMYKFIDVKGVNRICEKYNLVIEDVYMFKGIVPELNLQHIENFKINETDECYMLFAKWEYSHIKGHSFTKYMNKEEFENEQLTHTPRIPISKRVFYEPLKTVVYNDKLGLKIVAPLGGLRLLIV